MIDISMIYMINKNTVRFLEIMKPHKLIERGSECEEMKRYIKIKKFTKICSGFVQVTYAAYTLFQNFGLNFIYLYERYHEKNVLPLKLLLSTKGQISVYVSKAALFLDFLIPTIFGISKLILYKIFV